VHEYDSNGGNGTRAYLAAYPEMTSAAVAASSAWRLLRNEKVRDSLAALRAARWKRLAMSGDEALALVALEARVDLRELFDEKGELLPVCAWPDSVACCVKAIRPGPFGTTIVLTDPHAARRLILEQTGALKNPIVGAAASIAKILAGNFSDEDDGE